MPVRYKIDHFILDDLTRDYGIFITGEDCAHAMIALADSSSAPDSDVQSLRIVITQTDADSKMAHFQSGFYWHSDGSQLVFDIGQQLPGPLGFQQYARRFRGAQGVHSPIVICASKPEEVGR